MRERLAGRENWQEEAGQRGLSAEQAFDAIMREHLGGAPFEAAPRPMDLADIYGVRTDARGRERPHGIRPDYALRNAESGRAVFVEIKRQRAAGNAHERACKYLTPGILGAMRERGNQPANAIPMWWVFTNGIATDPRYVQEIMFWFRGIEGNVLLWGDTNDPAAVVEHFERFIRPMLA